MVFLVVLLRPNVSSNGASFLRLSLVQLERFVQSFVCWFLFFGGCLVWVGIGMQVRRGRGCDRQVGGGVL